MRAFIKSKKRDRLGVYVLAAREKNGMTQAEMARRMEMHPQVICRLEKGVDASFSTLLKVAKVLNISFGELLDN